LAIARLAPQDYHRFHSPVEGEVIAIKDIKGRLALFSARGAHIPSQASYTASLLPARGEKLTDGYT